ncbi:unnamed protein product [Fraxinus pennsylvanica]|uniref:Uncharacterized protein n=1 Tax=Fraxinus pennsylvanica TaxID=56036 RepID=A0AAD1YPL4_9LAMI|nr:unnamed protein product [Fraxinus pennsylvanica]
MEAELTNQRFYNCLVWVVAIFLSEQRPVSEFVHHNRIQNTSIGVREAPKDSEFEVLHRIVISNLSLRERYCNLSRSIIMNKGGAGLGSGAGGSGGGPTAAAAAAAAQKQKTLLQRVDNDIGNLVDNFGFLVNVARVNDPPVRNSQEAFMMEMRAARMVQAADSLLKLVSELKQTAIFSGFASLNDHVDQRTEEFNKLAEKTNSKLARIGEEAVASLKELESHYYSSALRTSIPPES